MTLLPILLALLIFPLSLVVPRWRGVWPAVLIGALGLYFLVAGVGQASQPNAAYVFALLGGAFAVRAWRDQPVRPGRPK